MTSIPLHRVATAVPFIDYLRRIGAPLERELRRARLPVLAMDDPDCFVPSRNYWTFIANVADHEGIEDLGFLVGQRSGANAVDAGLTQRLLRSPTLHHALDRFCKLATVEISRVTLWLAPGENNTHRLYYQPSFDGGHPAYVHFQWYGVMATIGAIRLFAGKHWQPDHMGLASQNAPVRAIRESFPNTRFQTGQAHCFIALDDRLLFSRCRPDENAATSLSDTTNIEPADDLSGSLKQALRSYLEDGAPPVGLAAELAGRSVRTLQRHLADKGQTYKRLLAQVRFDTATYLLRNRDYTITDIARQLGYSDPSHFARAFRRIAGVSPREYLEHCQS